MMLDDLAKELDRLVPLIQSGQWDVVSEAVESFVLVLQSARIELRPVSTATPDEVVALATMKAKIDDAIARCNERKTQIGPLLEVLERPRRSV